MRPAKVLSRAVCTALLGRVQLCNQMPAEWLPLVVDEEDVGAVLTKDVEQLTASEIFRVDDGVFRLSAELEGADVETRNEAVAALAEDLRDRGIVRGWRDELVPVASGFGREPKFLVERAAYPLLGAKGYGVHVNGYTADGELWVAKRSTTKQTWPGLYDHLVAGHQPIGMTPKENVVKEAAEEAGIPRTVAERAVPVGVVSYRGLENELGRFKNDVLFCFDLELPRDFVPVPVDGEVESFAKWPVETVVETILDEDTFKPNVVLVIVDFLVRHGFLQPEMPDYLPLVKALRQGDCC